MVSTQKGQKQRTAGQLSGTTTTRRRAAGPGKSQNAAPTAAQSPSLVTGVRPMDRYRPYRLALIKWTGENVFSAPLLLMDAEREALMQTLGGLALKAGLVTAFRVARCAGPVRLEEDGLARQLEAALLSVVQTRSQPTREARQEARRQARREGGVQ